jgi:hypothetical protein
MARYGVMMGLQRIAFALPLYCATPLSGLAVVFVMPRLSSVQMTVASMPLHQIWPLALMMLCGWLTEILVTITFTWRKKIPRLALDETLFYQPSFNALLLEQYTLINRRSRDESESPTDDVVLSNEEEMRDSRLFVCTTMYQEDVREMRQLLKSVIMAGAEMSEKLAGHFESHIFMDGAVRGDEPQLYALQLLNCLQDVVREYETLHGDDPAVQVVTSDEARKRLVTTPYGARVELTLPGPFRMYIHLKDPGRVKKKKVGGWTVACCGCSSLASPLRFVPIPNTLLAQFFSQTKNSIPRIAEQTPPPSSFSLLSFFPAALEPSHVHVLHHSLPLG